LRLKPNTGNTPVKDWTYGTDLPSFVVERCAPLEIGHTYRVSIAGDGFGSEVFTLGDGRASNGRCRADEAQAVAILEHQAAGADD